MCFVPQRRAIFAHPSSPRPPVFKHFVLKMCFAPQRRFMFPHPNFQKWSEHGVLCTFWFGNVFHATMACNSLTSQLLNVVRAMVCLHILTCKCASRHNGLQFLDIRTFKSGPKLVCFVHFDLKMCFAPQRCANFSFLLWPHGSTPAPLASLLFDPHDPQIIRKNTFATFLIFRAPVSSFFYLLSSDSFSFSLLLFSSAFHLSILPEVWLLNFLRI